MKARKRACILAICIVLVLNCTYITVYASDICSENFIKMEDMQRELLDESEMKCFEDDKALRATGSISGKVPAHELHTVNQKFYLSNRQIITINCSYTPLSASVDFGVIAPNGYFYFTNVKGGSINQSIEVNQNGSYLVAIRNNSANVVAVVGFVTY